MEQKKDVMKMFKEVATNLVDLDSITKAISNGLNTDIKKGDFVISTELYNSSIFVCDPIMKQRGKKMVELPNPYEEWVTKNTSRLDLTTKAYEDDEDAFKEKRIKVKKLCLLDWDEENNTYPRQSDWIIFRQCEINFKKQFENDLRHLNYMLNHTDPRIQKRKDELQIKKLQLEKLMEIPPFMAYADKKYGFLIKREISINRIVMHNTKYVFSSLNVTEMMNEKVEEKVNQLVEHAEKRKGDAETFREAIVMEGFKPERVMQRLEKYGEDALEEKVVVGVGKAK